MHWLALQWALPEGGGPTAHALPARDALAWWALGFTPHVVWVDEALLLEVSSCERLWGGRRALLRRVFESNPAPARAHQAQEATSLIAIAQLRMAVAGRALSSAPAALPLHTLSAARPHLGVLTRLGCRTWGQVDALPRAGLARRFGPELGRALDIAFGRAPDVYAWIAPPEHFDQFLELPERVDSAAALLWSARRLLQALQHWLAARQQAVLALELAWTFDQRRLNGRALPPVGSLILRTAEGVQGMDHIQRLLAERLARTLLAAPARAIRLRALETAPWHPMTPSFLPEDQPRGEPLHVFVERVGARLGKDSVRVPVLREDHRPECRQGWQPAEQAMPRLKAGATPWPVGLPDAVCPTWLLRRPQPLDLQDGQPCHRGQRLRLIAGPHRVETGWWAGAVPSTAAADVSPPVARDYFIAQSPSAELMWVYRERPMTSAPCANAPRWFLQGLYA